MCQSYDGVFTRPGLEQPVVQSRMGDAVFCGHKIHRPALQDFFPRGVFIILFILQNFRGF